MRLRWLGLLSLVALLQAGPALAKLPATVEEFKTRLAEEGKHPEKFVHLWFEAIYVYGDEDEAVRERGRAMLDLVMPNEAWEKDDKFTLTLAKQPYLYRSYAKGATPENDYRMDPDDFALEFVRSATGEPLREGLLYLRCGGADHPRPFSIKADQTTGLYRMAEFSSLCVGVKKPASQQ